MVVSVGVRRDGELAHQIACQLTRGSLRCLGRSSPPRHALSVPQRVTLGKGESRDRTDPEATSESLGGFSLNLSPL